MENRQEITASISKPSEGLQGRHVIDDAIITAGQLYHVAERTEYPPEGGIYVYYKGMPFPKKGYPFPEAAYANDNMKRVMRFCVMLIHGKEMFPSIAVFALLPWKFKLKKIEQVVSEIVRIGIWLLNEAFLKTSYYSNPSKEAGAFVYEFCIALGIDKTMHSLKRDDGSEMGMKRERPEGADPTWVTMLDNRQSYIFSIAQIVATVIEYDDAYRFRLEDILSETSKEALMKDPRGEIKRLTAIFMSREKTHATDMIGRISRVLQLLLLHPKIRKAFKEALRTLKFDRLQLDNADRYHVLIRGDYDFTGRSVEDRKRIYTEFHMLSKCCNERVKFARDAEGNTIGGRCKKCWKELETMDVTFDFPPMIEVSPGQ